MKPIEFLKLLKRARDEKTDGLDELCDLVPDLCARGAKDEEALQALCEAFPVLHDRVRAGAKEAGEARSAAFEVLIQRVREQDRLALGALFTAFAPALHVSVRCQWSTETDATIQDIVSETFLTLLEKPYTPKPDETTVSSFPGLLRTIADRDLRKKHKTDAERKRVPIPDEFARAAPEVVSKVEVDDEVDRVWKFIDELPPDERDAIRLWHHHHVPQIEIAARHNCTVGTIKSRISRGLVKVRQALGCEVPVGEPQTDAQTPETEAEIEVAPLAAPSEAAAPNEVQK